MSAASDDLQQTPLHALHLELGARMVPFAGYSMPVQYPAGRGREPRRDRIGTCRKHFPMRRAAKR